MSRYVCSSSTTAYLVPSGRSSKVTTSPLCRLSVSVTIWPTRFCFTGYVVFSPSLGIFERPTWPSSDTFSFSSVRVTLYVSVSAARPLPTPVPVAVLPIFSSPALRTLVNSAVWFSAFTTLFSVDAPNFMSSS